MFALLRARAERPFALALGERQPVDVAEDVLRAEPNERPVFLQDGHSAHQERHRSASTALRRAFDTAPDCLHHVKAAQGQIELCPAQGT